MTPFLKLWAYTIKQSATLMSCGLCKWEVFGNKEQKAQIAKRAVCLGMKVNTEDRLKRYGETYQSMIVSY